MTAPWKIGRWPQGKALSRADLATIESVRAVIERGDMTIVVLDDYPGPTAAFAETQARSRSHLWPHVIDVRPPDQNLTIREFNERMEQLARDVVRSFAEYDSCAVRVVRDPVTVIAKPIHPFTWKPEEEPMPPSCKCGHKLTDHAAKGYGPCRCVIDTTVTGPGTSRVVKKPCACKKYIAKEG